jgi:hypothetical protein
MPQPEYSPMLEPFISLCNFKCSLIKNVRLRKQRQLRDQFISADGSV